MALVTIHAVVHIAVNVAMIVVGVRLGVAVRALEDAVIGRICMTRRTDSIGVTVIHGEPRVIESGSQPARGRVASGARGRESCRHVVRIVRALIIHLVTAKAVGRHRGVVVVHVATRACNGRVLPRQWETCVVVVKACWTPGCRTVAYVALLWESGRNVVRTVRALEILQVATHAGRVGDVVVRIGVALATLQSGVSARQRPSSGRVIEGRSVPVRGRMANLALLREASRRVIGIVCALEVFQMAGDASRAA